MYKEILLQKKHNSHYLFRYIKFIDFHSNQIIAPGKYKEQHHILPKSLWPEFENLYFHKWNSINLTGRQHFIAHWMLWKAFGGSMTKAFQMMLKQTKSMKRYTRISSRTYETLKKDYATIMSTEMRGSGNHMFGKTHSLETREKISKNRKYKTGIDHPNYGKDRKWVGPKISKKAKGKITAVDINGNSFKVTVEEFAKRADLVTPNTEEGFRRRQINFNTFTGIKWVVYDQHNNQHNVFDLKTFCKTNNLGYDSIRNTNPYKRHKGWYCIRG